MTDFYVCPQHAGTGGYEPCCNCGGWKPDDPDFGKLCTEAEEADCLRRLRGVSANMVAVTDYKRNLALSRRDLIRELLDLYGWSQHGVADLLDISQAAVSKILKKQDRDDGEEDDAVREYRELVARYDSDPEYRERIRQLAEEVGPP